MKLTIPGILIAALIVAPTAFAQGTNYSGSSSNPATSVSKDETTSMTKPSTKRMASHKKKHHAKPMSSQTTGSGISSAPKY